MGIDACGYFLTKDEITNEQLETLNERLYGCCFEGWQKKDPTKQRESWEGDGIPFKRIDTKKFHIDFNLRRHWGIGYERARFESVIAVVAWLRRQPEIEKVFYYGDCVDEEDASEFTAEREAEYLEHWLSKGYPYRNR